jgi:hypothetical protein
MAFAVIQGVDYSFDHPTPAELKRAGKHFACRYVYPASQTPGTKNLTRAEATALRDAGIEVVSNYESWAARAESGRGAGQSDARAADAQHRACGGPGHRPIFFSVDFDTTSADYRHIDAYFGGVASVIGTSRTGVYGEYDLCRHLIDAGLIGKSESAGFFYAWQTYAWSAGEYDERCCCAQDKNGVKLGSGTVDLDSAHCADYGQWGYKKPAKKPPAKKPPAAKPPPPIVGANRPVTRGEAVALIEDMTRAVLHGTDQGYATSARYPLLVRGEGAGVLDRLRRLEKGDQ